MWFKHLRKSIAIAYSMWASISYVWWLSHLRPFSWVFLPWSKSAASLKETRRPVVPVERKRSVSWSWELAIDKHSDSSTLMVISTRDIREKRQRKRTGRWMGEGPATANGVHFNYLLVFILSLIISKYDQNFVLACFTEDESRWLWWSSDSVCQISLNGRFVTMRVGPILLFITKYTQNCTVCVVQSSKW